ncbi:MAG: phosphoenolpyruvate carboxylase, partial [Acidimicrobiaceae bacterium]|nr:phosphoenolpyruvate carboxylase [Acidimicrobiaceae bacterium]
MSATSLRVEPSGVDDIRLLGRVLGEVIADQSGPEMLDIVESIRRAAAGERRAGSDGGAGRLEALLAAASEDQELQIIRAFSTFVLLANLAEDVADNRRARAERRAGRDRSPGTLAWAFDQIGRAALSREDLVRLAGDVVVSPVFTAHPTEVRRRTALTRAHDITRLLTNRDRTELAAGELDEWREALRVEVLTLWQTAILRPTRLRVRDEINAA